MDKPFLPQQLIDLTFKQAIFSLGQFIHALTIRLIDVLGNCLFDIEPFRFSLSFPDRVHDEVDVEKGGVTDGLFLTGKASGHETIEAIQISSGLIFCRSRGIGGARKEGHDDYRAKDGEGILHVGVFTVRLQS